MTKKELFEKTKAVKTENQEALETMYEALSQTQKKKMAKNEKVKKTFDRHGVRHNP